jgi:uncharacterized protein YoxC
VTITEICLVIIALSALCVGGAAIFIATRVTPLVQRFEQLAETANQTVERLNGLIEELRTMAREVQHVQSRVTNVASEILNILQPSVKTISTVVGVLRSGLTSLLGLKGSSRRHETLDNPRESGSAPTG